MEQGKLLMIFTIVILVLFFIMMAVFYVFLKVDNPTTGGWINTRWGGYGIRNVQGRAAPEPEWAR